MLKFIRNLHKWIAVGIGIQVLLWMLTGVYFSWISIHNVRGELDSAVYETALPKTDYLSPMDILERSTFEVVQEIHIKMINDQVYYIVTGADRLEKERFHAASGLLASPITEAEAREIAVLDFTGDASIREIALIEQPETGEYRKALPAWRVSFDNSKNTAIYIDANTGEITARRNTLWRIFDWLWMLHIMDYDERDDINNWLLKSASIIGATAVLSGITLFFLTTVRRRRNRLKTKLQPVQAVAD